MAAPKPLGRKAYGSIGQLPGSRLGPGDHRVTDGQARICLERAGDRHDRILVTEKVDGSCCAVALVDGQLYPLGRAGHLASSSPYEQHQLFARWVWMQEARFRAVLREGERLVGEWLAQAHGTRYALPHEPFVVFDLMEGQIRVARDEFASRVAAGEFVTPRLLSDGPPYGIEAMLGALEPSAHGALDPVEGAVWRVERRGAVDYLAKFVRPDKVDGCYLPELSGEAPVWHWRPERDG